MGCVRIVVEEYPYYGECPFGVEKESEDGFLFHVCGLPCAKGAKCEGFGCPYLVSLQEVK